MIISQKLPWICLRAKSLVTFMKQWIDLKKQMPKSRQMIYITAEALSLSTYIEHLFNVLLLQVWACHHSPIKVHLRLEAHFAQPHICGFDIMNRPGDKMTWSEDIKSNFIKARTYTDVTLSEQAYISECDACLNLKSIWSRLLLPPC